MKTIINPSDLKCGEYTVIDRVDGTETLEGTLERVLYPKYPIPSRWMAENYPELNQIKYQSIYPRLILIGRDKCIYSAPMNLNHFIIRQGNV